MNRPIVCLSFDFDAISAYIARGQRSPSALSQGEFGPHRAAPRLLELLRKYAIPSTWFVPGHTIESFPQACETVVAAGHEIAHHGWTHRPPADLTRDQEEHELVRGNESIRRLTGHRARGYRSPSWDLSPHSVELLLKHGFTYDSSMMGDDHMPYFARQGDRIELEQPARLGTRSPLIELPISWTLDDSPAFTFMRTQAWVKQGLMNANLAMENWLNDFVYLAQTGDWGVLTLTCHPWIIGRGHRIMAFERMIAGMLSHDAQFMTMEAAAQAFRRQLTK